MNVRNANGKLPWSSIAAIASLIGILVSGVAGYVTTKNAVASNVNKNIEQDKRIDEIEDEGKDTSNRLTRIETLLEQILRNTQTRSP